MKEKATEKRRRRDPGEIWVKLLANTMERKATMMETVNAPLKPRLKMMRRHSGR